MDFDSNAQISMNSQLVLKRLTGSLHLETIHQKWRRKNSGASNAIISTTEFLKKQIKIVRRLQQKFSKKVTLNLLVDLDMNSKFHLIETQIMYGVEFAEIMSRVNSTTRRKRKKNLNLRKQLKCKENSSSSTLLKSHVKIKRT